VNKADLPEQKQGNQAGLAAALATSAAIGPGARVMPSPKNVVYQRRFWSICLPRS